MCNKLRLHLAAGATFMKWQVTTPEGVEYYDPETTQFRLTGCKLRNRPAEARKILEGANKSVCAFVEFEGIEIVSGIETGEQLRFNPRVYEHWHKNWREENLDGARFDSLTTSGRSVCLPQQQ